MAWLSTLETTLTSPQARAVMAEALRAVANVLEAPRSGEHGKGGGAQEGRRAVSAAGSLVAAPLEVAAAAIGAAGNVLTGALRGAPGENGGNGTSRTGGRTSSRKKS